MTQEETARGDIEHAGAHPFTPGGRDWRGDVQLDRCAFEDCGAGPQSSVHVWPASVPVHNNWQQIPGHPAGNIRCIETGIEIRAIGHGFRWEVLYPVWRRPDRKVLRTDRIFTTKIEALGHATRSTRPLMRERIALAFDEAHIEDGFRLVLRGAPTPEERISAAPPATDAEIARATGYATGLRARILKRLQVAEARVAELERRAAKASFVSHDGPYPRMTSVASRGQEMCLASSPGDGSYGCTREAGHGGNHEAGGSGDALASRFAEWAQ